MTVIFCSNKTYYNENNNTPLCNHPFLFILRKSSTNPPLEEPYPHQWIFTADASADKYVHLSWQGTI
ncbi:MAG: hypothetical protein IPI36_10650 [Chitinophagaceae bacterium]|nr:hypothetical protein [Chitinophagaceae bacterium]